MELITSPKVLFLDEPTTGLDANTAYSVMHLLQRSEFTATFASALSDGLPNCTLLQQSGSEFLLIINCTNSRINVADIDGSWMVYAHVVLLTFSIARRHLYNHYSHYYCSHHYYYYYYYYYHQPKLAVNTKINCTKNVSKAERRLMNLIIKTTEN